ncbi:MMPL family transporter, partial [candidate division GN15 bacterium]|nr:MMPL family transporter [candidate division GN15 bacterium]
MKISEISIRQPVFATMMIAALLVLGWFSYTDLPVELFPKVDFPFVVVQTAYPGSSAESVETEVTKKIEDVINEISGVRHIQATSSEGYSLILVEFELEIDGAVATQDVREKVSTVRGDLPDDIEDPVVSQYDPDAEAIMSIAISGRRPPREVTQLVKDKIKPRLESIGGVGSVRLVGGYEREILVALDPDRMEAKEVTINEVAGAVQAANLEIPGGRVDEAATEYLVRVMGRLQSVDAFRSIIVKNENGTPIYLSDVAVVKDTIAEQRSLSTFNGETAIALDVVKQSGANVVQLAEEVRATLNGLNDELPPDISVTVVNDNSVFITDAIHEILFNIQFGTALAVLVIFLFLLDLRPTIITGLSIPISIIATFTAMKFLGFSINFMTLLGLSLAVGILIDDSIVVVENIYRKVQEGETPWKAAFTGTREIGLAVAATTFSIMVVFLPVAFMEGIVGRFFYQFGMTVAIAVLISLFVAFTLVPMLTSRTKAPKEDPESLDPARAKGWWRVWLQVRRPLSVWNRAFESLRPHYKELLAFSLNHRWLIALVATGAFAAAIFAATFLPVEWMAQSDQGKMYISIETPPGTDLEHTYDRVRAVEEIVTDLDEVAGTYVTIGAGNNEVTKATLLVLLTDATTREISAQQLVDSTRVLTSQVPGIKAAFATQVGEGGSQKPIELSIRGDDREELERLTHKVERMLAEIPGAVDIDNTLQEGQPELQITVRRKLADDLGLDLAAISQTIRTLVEGDDISRYKEGDDEYDVRLRLQEEYRASRQDVGRILIASDKEIPGKNAFLVPLDRVADIRTETAVGELRRYDRLPEVRVNANAASWAASGTISTTLQAQVDTTVQLSPGYSVGAVGQEEIREESSTNILRALILSVVFIYLVLASQYESFFDPLSI